MRRAETSTFGSPEPGGVEHPVKKRLRYWACWLCGLRLEGTASHIPHRRTATQCPPYSALSGALSGAHNMQQDPRDVKELKDFTEGKEGSKEGNITRTKEGEAGGGGGERGKALQ